MSTTGEHPVPGMAVVTDVLRQAIDQRDLSMVRSVLDAAATWGDCAGRESVLEFLTGAASAVGAPDDVSLEIVADRIIATLPAQNGEPLTIAMFVRDGKLVELIDAADHEHALTVRPVGDLAHAAEGGWLPSRVSPVLPVADLAGSVLRFRTLGFDVHTYEGEAAYAFATRGSIEFHLTQVRHLDPMANTSAAYLYVDDADATYASWRLAGVKGRLTAPSDTDYGLREGSYVDPDGNLIRFGSAQSSSERRSPR